MKKILITLFTLISLITSTNAFANNNPSQYPNLKPKDLTMSDLLITHLNVLEEFSCIDYRFMKPNTNCIISNDFPYQFGHKLKQTTIYFYKENIPELTMEFENPDEKDDIITQCEYKYKSKSFEPKYEKETLNSGLYYETYEWKNWMGKVILTYSTHPALGTHLTLSILKDNVIKDPNYKNPKPQHTI